MRTSLSDRLDAASLPGVPRASDHVYATPRPMTRSGYLVRSNKAVGILKTGDAILRACLPRPKHTAALAQPKRIVVANWAHLGDVLTSLSTLRFIRESFPDCKLDLVVGRGSQVAVEGSNLFDRLHTVDHFLLNRSKKSRADKFKIYREDRERFLAKAATEKYEIGIDLYPYFPPASPLFWKAGIPTRCGFTSGGFGSLLSHPVRWSFENKPIGQYGCNLISALWPDLGAGIGHLAPYYPEEQRRKLPGHLAPPDPNYVIMHIGSGAPSREWPEHNWYEVIKRWPREAPLLVFCGTGPAEEARARRIAGHCAEGRSFLFVNQSWRDYAALLAAAAGIVCLESSASHLAAALSIPTVAIYTGTNDRRLWGPDNPDAIVLVSPTACAPCHRYGCDSMACIRGVTPDDVMEAIERTILSRASGEAQARAAAQTASLLARETLI
jgi:ADP-heptose:LPS heptosyltransferase